MTTVSPPRIVTICGSTRFRAEMTEANRIMTLAGRIVIAPGVFAHSGDAMTDEQKAALDELHLRKIDLADEVLVINPGGYVGESTRHEIAYAKRAGKPISYVAWESPGAPATEPLAVETARTAIAELVLPAMDQEDAEVAENDSAAIGALFADAHTITWERDVNSAGVPVRRYAARGEWVIDPDRVTL